MGTRWLTVDGLRIRAVDVAPERERDDPVLMIHGLAGWAENWGPAMGPIARSGRRAIAIDLPGFGQSERARRSRYFDPEDPFYAPFVFAVLDALGIPRAHIVGHSFGGAVAYTAAVWCPERVRSLTLVAPGGLGADLLREFRMLTLPGMGLLALLPRSRGMTRQVVHACFHDPSRCPEELVDDAVRYARRAGSEMVRALRSSVSFRHGVRDEVRRPWIERGARYTGRALVVWGAEDAILPVGQADEARRLAARTEVRIIPSCGHLVMVEQPERFASVLLPFLEQE